LCRVVRMFKYVPIGKQLWAWKCLEKAEKEVLWDVYCLYNGNSAGISQLRFEGSA
jgi:hypothetical protein